MTCYTDSNNLQACLEIKLFPGKSSLVNKTVFHVQTREGVRSEFWRISYQYLSEPSKVVIQYVGDSAVAEAFPHGNSNDASKAYVRSCPSLLASLKLGVQSDWLCWLLFKLHCLSYLPSYIYKRATGTDVEPVLQPVMAPRNSKQVENAAYSVNSNKRLSQDSIYNLVETAYDLQSFVHKMSVFPHLTVICGSTQIVKHCNLALLSSPTDSPAILSYDTTFCLGDFYVSVLIFRMTVFNSAPVIPALFLIHDCKTSITHQEFFPLLVPSFQPFKHSSTTGDRPRTSYRQSHCFLSATWDTFTWVEPPAAGHKAIRENQLMWDSNCERWRAQSSAPNFARRSRQIREKWTERRCLHTAPAKTINAWWFALSCVEQSLQCLATSF